jgi:branched-chain amino acid transport system substrate-binding protein
MLQRKYLVAAALLGALAMVGAACGNDNGGTGATGTPSAGSTDVCATDAFGCVTYASGQPIKFASLLAISGATATLGTDSNNGIKLGMDYLDGTFDATNGQIDGHDVTLEEEDDGCSKDGGQAGATKLAADDTIAAVVGTSCSSSALGVADTILSAKGILLVSPSNTAAGLTAEGTHQDFYLRTAQNDAIQAKVVADFVFTKLGFQKAATIHDESPYAAGLTGGFKTFFEQLGGTVTDEEAIQSTDTDFKPLLTTIAQTQPQLIYAPDFNDACWQMAQQMKQVQGLENVPFMGSDGCLATDFFDKGGSDVDGSYLSGPIPAPGGTTSALLDQYNQAYKDQFGDPTASFNANAFDAFNIIVEAIKKVAVQGSDGSLTIPRDALRNAIYQTKDYEGITGSLTCIPTGDCQSESAVNIAVFQAPKGGPAIGGSADDAIFTEQLTLGQALGQ